MCLVCAWHTGSGFSRNRKGYSGYVQGLGYVTRTSLCLLVSVWVVSSSLESPNTSQITEFAKNEGKSFRAFLGCGVQAYLPQESAVS